MIQVWYLHPSSHPGHTRSHSIRWIISQAREISGSGGTWQGVTDIKCQAINKGGELYFQWRFIFSQPIWSHWHTVHVDALLYQWYISSLVQVMAWCRLGTKSLQCKQLLIRRLTKHEWNLIHLSLSCWKLHQPFHRKVIFHILKSDCTNDATFMFINKCRINSWQDTVNYHRLLRVNSWGYNGCWVIRSV